VRRLYLTSVLPPPENVMSAREKLTTIVSAKGQIILPKAIRQELQWEAGTQLVVENTPEGVLLKAAALFAPTKSEDVFGSLAWAGRPRTLEEMEAGIATEAKRRHARHPT